jgi:hypothetical protein
VSALAASHADARARFLAACAGRMRDAFSLADDEWKEKVCRRAQEVPDRALAGMAAWRA